jgi:hypothetical protein
MKVSLSLAHPKPESLTMLIAEVVQNTLESCSHDVSLTTTTIERERQAFGDPLKTLWENCIFGLCEVMKFYRTTYNVVKTSTLRREKLGWMMSEIQLPRIF